MRSLLLFAALCLSAGCGATGNSSDGSNYDSGTAQATGGVPPYSPVQASSVVADASLNARCASLIDQVLPRTEIRYAVVTESNKWGRVWRADLFSFSTGQIGRIVCWDPLDDPSDQVVHEAKYRDETDLALPGQ